MQPFDPSAFGFEQKLDKPGRPVEVVRKGLDLLATDLMELEEKLRSNDPEIDKYLAKTKTALLDVVYFPQLAAAQLIPPVLTHVKTVADAAPAKHQAQMMVMASIADDAVMCYAKIATLPEPVRAHVAGWFDTHLPGTTGLEWIMLIKAFGDQLATTIERYAKRATEGVPTGAPDAILTKAITAIGTTPLHKPRFTKEGITKVLHDRLSVLNERDFNRQYIAYILRITRANRGESEANLNDQAYCIAAEVDTKLGFCDGERMYLRDRNTGVSSCIHEAMHMLSSPAWKEALGDCLNEGATEHFSRVVCKQHNIPYDRSIYMWNVEVFTTIMKVAELDQSALEEAYFAGNVEKVRKAIVDISGEEGMRILLENYPTDEQTARKWLEHCKVYQRTCVVQ
ncbi:hypothetical protein MCAG_02495 [Micromonospora sp. ATCC 39149]|nr:hypothetical protein MCAG_02495 [Micromonospora sp. ATCC 39149]